jgi:hypothetical protein
LIMSVALGSISSPAVLTIILLSMHAWLGYIQLL